MSTNKVYKCFASDLTELKKRIKRITKKLDQHGIKWAFNVIDTKPEKVAIYDYRGIKKLPASQRFAPKAEYIVLDVTSYTFEMESLKIGSYSVVATLEHGDNGNNIVHIIDENHSHITEHYKHAKAICEHCNHNRFRSITVILHNGENYIQVGKSCLQEYTGINCYDIIKGYQDAQSICIEDVSITDDGFYPKESSYHATIDYLASCIHQIKTNGYIKEETKSKAWNEIKKYDTYAYCIEEAKKVINYFTVRDFNDNFMHNIKAALSNEYSKQTGFIAYAYIAWTKAVENDLKEEQRNKENALCDYVGNIGDRIQLELIYEDRYSYETEYGIQRIYIFRDKDNNCFKWSTSKALNKDDEYRQFYEIGDSILIKGTIKAHEEYEGLKQTVLTRCKIV